jgi:hypothetical protein
MRFRGMTAPTRDIEVAVLSKKGTTMAKSPT